MAKLTNEQKFRTAEERINAFGKFCNDNLCDKSCAAYGEIICDKSWCMARWLALEAEEEKPEPCPFCGGRMNVYQADGGGLAMDCDNCGYVPRITDNFDSDVAAHNRVARAVRAAEEREVK